MEKIINYRPLALGLKNRDGRQIKQNTIHRSGNVAFATKNDIQTLIRYGIKYIYDFRSADETRRAPALSVSGFSTLRTDIVKEASPHTPEKMQGMDAAQIKQSMIDMYARLLSRVDAYRPVFAAIEKQETDAFLYHCSAGKDRTGIFSAILMMALDFDMQAIKEEYLRIDRASLQKLKQQMLDSTGLDDTEGRLDPMFTVLPDYIDAYIHAITQTHGSTDAYLAAVFGITQEEKVALQRKYLV